MALTKKQNITQVIKFTLFSASAGIIEVLSFTFLFELFGLSHQVSYLIALILSVLYNFTLNRSFTFQSSANVPRAMMIVGLYYLIFTPLSTWWMGPLALYVGNEYIALAITMIANFGSEFSVYRFIVYRKSMYTNKRALSHKEEAYDSH